MEKTFNIMEFFYTLRRYLWVIILITSITTGAGIYLSSKLVPSYQGYMKIFVGTDENMMKFYSEEELASYGNFINIFTEIVGIDEFMNSTLNKYNLKVSAASVRGGLRITGGTNTPIYTLSYTSYDHDKTGKVLKAVCEEFTTQVESLLPGKKVYILNDVTVGQIMPSKTKRIEAGLGIGIAISLIFIFIKYYLDNTIKSREELEKLLAIPVLVEIPSHEKAFIKEEKKHASSRKNAKVNISRGIQDTENKN